MKQAILFFIKYYLFWIAFFLFYKVFFLAFNFSICKNFPLSDWVGIFSHGIIMDLSAAGYLSLFPGIIIASGFVFFPKTARNIIRIYTLALLILLVIMGLGDAGLYEEWGGRLSSQIFLYLQNPGGMYAAMTLVQIIALFVLWIALTLLWYRIYKKIFAEKKDALSKLNWGTLPLMLFLTSLLILPIRGGTNTSPLNYSSVYFSDNLQANQSAYNFFWNLFYTLTQDKFKHNPVSYMKAGEAQKIVESSYDAKEEFPSYISTNNNKPVNVIVIILESFSGKIVGPEGDYKNATPNLNEVCKNGIFFNNFFATGNRSDKGICALIGGYPSVINGTTRLSSPEKMRKLFYFPKHFKEHGYSLSFFYGGDINFYNTKTALIQSGFDKMISNISFSKDIASLQKWGVPDEHLYNRTFEELKNQKQPFLSMIYNISSHDPFDVPFHKIKGDDRPSKYFNSIAYSDSCLGVFIRKLKASPLWENTLVVITADHCTPLPDQSSIESPRSYRIPLLWTGGVVKQSFICNNFAMQNDLGPTLLQQMGWAVKYPTFSKNIFSKRNYAFYFRDAGWGFVSPKAQFFQNINNRKLDVFHMEPKQNSDSIINFAKAYVQFLHDDFIKN